MSLSSGKTIVMATWGSFGDLHPYMAVSKELLARGHKPAIATTPIYREKVETAGIRFHPVGPALPPPDEAEDIVRRAIDRRTGGEYIFRELLGPHIRKTWEDTLAAVEADGGADLVVSHPIAMTVPLIVERAGIPWVSTVLSPISFFSVYDPPTPPSFSGLREIMRLHPALARAVLVLGKRVSRRWVSAVDDLRRELGLSPGAHPLFEGQHSPRRVLALFSPVFGAPQRDFPPNTVVTGFPFYDAADAAPPNPDLERFLDAGPPPLLFTLGSSAIWAADDFYQIGLESARRLGTRALLLVGHDQNRPPGPLPSSVGVFEYEPYGRLMPRTLAVVHQGGIGTTAQALRAGRPAVIMPFGHDTLDNARRVRELGAGVTVSRRRFGPRVLTDALRKATGSAYRERAEALGERIRAEDSVGRACDLLEREIRGR